MHGLRLKFWCTRCAAHALLEPHGEYVRRVENEIGLGYTFGACVNCAEPGVMMQEEMGFEEQPWTSPSQIFPILAPLGDTHLPDMVRDSYREARKCMMAESWIAAVVMIRRTLEAIGKTFKPESRGLHEAFRYMKEQGAISAEIAEWGDELRFIGNTGAHPTPNPPSKIDAKDAFDFLEAILEIIFTLRPKFQDMKKRRKGLPPP